MIYTRLMSRPLDKKVKLNRRKGGKSLKIAQKQPVQYFILRAVSIGKRVKISDIVAQIERTITAKDSSARKVRPAYTIKRTIKKLEDDGLLAMEFEESNEYVKLTQDGLEKLHDQTLISKDSVIPLTGWDGTYRLVIITTKDKSIREKLRYALTRAQFELLAPGVYATKLNMDHFIEQLEVTCPKSFVSFSVNKKV
jgi:DNA-binding PadR family transcriptional regulator